MKELMIFKCNTQSSTAGNTYSNTVSSVDDFEKNDKMDNYEDFENRYEIGKYSIFDVANWFLEKENMTQKKLQKLCYYAQAWCYALKGYRLINTDFQAWVHGPVSPVLYEKFKVFGYDTIKLNGEVSFPFNDEEIELLEDVWATYGDRTGNALEALSHTETPWIEARKGYAENERCSVEITPKSMRDYYKTIYLNE